MDLLIKAENLNFTYNKGKDNEFQALININLNIYPEEFIIIFGPSGCGKSTLLNVIAGLETPDSGSITVSGQEITNMNKKAFALYHRSKIGMIYQAYNLITTLTVIDNVALPQIFLNRSKRKREKIANELLERFGIAPQARKIPTELSGGQQQRIGIARAIINNPEIVLADEPVGNLDSVSAKNVLDILADLNDKEKKTIIMVTHNPENLVYGDRIIYMKDGMITREVVNREKHKGILQKRELAPKSVTAELLDLMRAYHGLSPEQINILIMPYKSKVFAHHFITNRSMEETKVFEDVIQRRLLGTISQNELMDILNRPSEEGGVGYDKRTAEKIMRRVNRVIRLAFFVYQKRHQRTDETGIHIEVTLDEKAERISDYLLRTCYLEHMDSLEAIQRERLQQSVKSRIAGEIQKADFFKNLDSPLKEGGAGLNSKTAKAITEELELILILGFGVVPMVKGQEDLKTAKEETINELVVEDKKPGLKLYTTKAKKIPKEEEPDGKNGPIRTEVELGNKKEVLEKIEKGLGGLDDLKELAEGEAVEIVSPKTESEQLAEEQGIDISKDTHEEKPFTLQDAIFSAQEREEQLKTSKK